MIIPSNQDHTTQDYIDSTEFRNVEMSARAANRLELHEIKTFKQLSEVPWSEIKRWRDCGKGTIAEYERILESRGIIPLWASDKRLPRMDPAIECLLKSMANGAFTEEELRNEARSILKRLSRTR